MDDYWGVYGGRIFRPAILTAFLFFILTFDIDSPEARNYRKNLEVEVTATRGVISPSPDTIYG